MTDENTFDQDFRTTAEANARTAGELEAKLLAKLEEKLPGMSGKDAAAAARDVSQVKARNIEKLRGLDAPPPTATDPAELLGSMVRKGYLKISGPAAALGLEATDDESKT